jgi:rhodanese-related sulfurtransferase
VPTKIEYFKSLEQPFVLCCASGNRSGQAAAFLKQHGIACENGGGWVDVVYQLKNQN